MFSMLMWVLSCLLGLLLHEKVGACKFPRFEIVTMKLICHLQVKQASTEDELQEALD